MGHSYWDSFENNPQLNINHSLHNALQKPNCASMNYVENVIDNGHFQLVPFETNKLQLVNERNEVISISFPAIINMEGNFSCIPPTFVSSLSFFPFRQELFVTQKDMKVPNPIYERYAQAIFQFSPLKESYKYEISREAIDCCTSAIHILQNIYHKAELTIQNREFNLFIFHVNFIYKKLKRF